MRNVVSRLFHRQSQEVTALPDITLTPIGAVRNSVAVSQAFDFDWQQVESRIMIRPELADALLGLDGYSHIVVLFWPHQVPPEVRGSKHELDPLDDPQNPLQGVLATRSQIRFNPILMTAARLLGVKRNVVKVSGLDAVNGSPVLDLKPYNPYFDAILEATSPSWLARAAERKRTAQENRGGH